MPDGLAFTAGGGLLISCYRPDRILHLDRDGRLEVVAEDPQGTLLSAPTNVCFVGAALDRVVSANLGRWHLTLLDARAARRAAAPPAALGRGRQWMNGRSVSRAIRKPRRTSSGVPSKRRSSCSIETTPS